MLVTYICKSEKGDPYGLWQNYLYNSSQSYLKALSTGIRIRLKTQLFFSVFKKICVHS